MNRRDRQVRQGQLRVELRDRGVVPVRDRARGRCRRSSGRRDASGSGRPGCCTRASSPRAPTGSRRSRCTLKPGRRQRRIGRAEVDGARGDVGDARARADRRVAERVAERRTDSRDPLLDERVDEAAAGARDRTSRLAGRGAAAASSADTMASARRASAFLFMKRLLVLGWCRRSESVEFSRSPAEPAQRDSRAEGHATCVTIR